MREQIKELALQAGGSHYPDVGGELLQQFADLVIQRCIKAVENTPNHCAFTTFQLDVVKCTKDMCADSIKKEFGL